MRKVGFLYPTITALILAAASAPASAVERAFRLKGAGQLTLGEDGSGTFTASGKATHLGRWTNAGTITFSPGLEPDTLDAAGEVTFTAANGDKLHATIDGVLDLSTGVGLADFVFVGGTGRFADAEGGADAVIHQNPDGSFTFTLRGVIDF